jgi:hypothetical protein
MQTTILKEIVAFFIGRKYYANIVATKGTAKVELCSFIFKTKQEAMKHEQEVNGTRSFEFVETISFRSKYEY